jgi:hypothetical protein
MLSPKKIISSAQQHETYIRSLLELQRKTHRTPEETETAKLLIVLIADPEARHFTIEKVSRAYPRQLRLLGARSRTNSDGERCDQPELQLYQSLESGYSGEKPHPRWSGTSASRHDPSAYAGGRILDGSVHDGQDGAAISLGGITRSLPHRLTQQQMNSKAPGEDASRPSTHTLCYRKQIHQLKRMLAEKATVANCCQIVRIFGCPQVSKGFLTDDARASK